SPDVAGVHDPVDAAQLSERFRTHEPVGVRHHPDHDRKRSRLLTGTEGRVIAGGGGRTTAAARGGASARRDRREIAPAGAAGHARTPGGHATARTRGSGTPRGG